MHDMADLMHLILLLMKDLMQRGPDQTFCYLAAILA